jgi:hypothetical protein
MSSVLSADQDISLRGKDLDTNVFLGNIEHYEGDIQNKLKQANIDIVIFSVFLTPPPHLNIRIILFMCKIILSIGTVLLPCSI